MNTSYIFLAAGFEEIEALTVVDVMRRAGMDIKTVSITDSHTVITLILEGQGPQKQIPPLHTNHF